MSGFNDELKRFTAENDHILPAAPQAPLNALDQLLEIGFQALRTEIDTTPKKD